MIELSFIILFNVKLLSALVHFKCFIKCQPSNSTTLIRPMVPGLVSKYLF